MAPPDQHMADQPLADQRLALAVQGAETLRAGGLAAFPTDTHYALSVLASHGPAVMRCYALKGRPDSEPMPIFLPSLAALDTVAADVPDTIRALAEAAWPGPLTLVLSRNPEWRSLAAPGKTVAVRIPDHPLALALLASIDEPITGSSANRHGEEPAETPEAIRDLFGEDVTILPALDVPLAGRPSTVLDCTGAEPRITRSGAMADDRVAELLSRHLTPQRN